jgi:hypothetical protein
MTAIEKEMTMMCSKDFERCIQCMDCRGVERDAPSRQESNVTRKKMVADQLGEPNRTACRHRRGWCASRDPARRLAARRRGDRGHRRPYDASKKGGSELLLAAASFAEENADLNYTPAASGTSCSSPYQEALHSGSPDPKRIVDTNTRNLRTAETREQPEWSRP